MTEAAPLRTLGDLLEEVARRGGGPAIVAHRDGGTDVWSGADLAERARQFAAGLLAAGLAAGEVVGLLAPNRQEWPAVLLGIVRAGGIAMPLSDQATDEELGRVLAHSGARVIVTTTLHLSSLAAIEDAPDLAVVVLDEAPEGRIERAATPWRELLGDPAVELPEPKPDRPALLLYTSGTTGVPKGVPLTHANLMANVEALRRAGLAGPGDRVLLPLPLHHAYPLTVGLLGPLAVGATVVLPAGQGGRQILRALARSRCTIMIGVPRLYEALLAGVRERVHGRGQTVGAVFERLLLVAVWLRRRFGLRIGRRLFAPLHRQLGGALRLLASGGARLDPEIAWTLEGLGWQVLTGYGLSETAPILTFDRPDRARIGSVGLPLAGVELRFEPRRDGGPGPGEILARGPNVFAGYWHDPEATAASFTEDGFFRTGDLGHLDDDGHLHIEGRSKELIVLGGGKNVFPEDLEAVYGQAALVREAAVLEQDGRLVGLFLPEIGAARDRSPDELGAELRAEIERLGRRLPSYQRLADLAVTRQALPRTQIGKLRRHELPELFAREKSGRRRPPPPVVTAADRALLETPPAGEVWRWLGRRFAGRDLTLRTSPQFDLGLDNSFDWMTLTMALEERFGIRLSDEAVGRISTLRDLLEEALQAETVEGASAAAPSAEQMRHLEPPGRVRSATAWALYRLNRVAMRWVFRVHAEGSVPLPAAGPLLITPNHASYLDPFALAAVLPWSEARRLHWAGWTGLLFRGPLVRLFSRIAQVVPVDPDRGLASTLAIGRAVLDRGGTLVWFPEGGRSADGRLLPFLPGVGFLMERAGARALPVLIRGSFEAWPPGRAWPRRHPIEVRFGTPIGLGDLLNGGAGAPAEDEGESGRHEAIATRLRAAVARLGERGASSPSPR